MLVLKQGENPAMAGAITSLGQNRFNGNIDDVRVYARALGPTEVEDLARGK